MALIVETGAIVASANSYVTLVQANAYFASVNNIFWDALDDNDQKIPFLVAAVRKMQQSYRLRWYGNRVNPTQVLDWPRYNVPRFDIAGGYGPYPAYYLPSEIPQEVKDAQCELALRANDGDLNADVSPEDNANMVKVGPITIQYNRSQSPLTIYTAVETLLAPLFEDEFGTTIERS